MVAIVSFNKRVPPGAAGSMTLKALMERQKAAADARAAAVEPRLIQDPMQGVAQVAQSVISGLQERRARNEEAAGREELARLKAQVGLGEYNPDVLSQIGLIDPDAEKMFREEALQARRDEAERQQALTLQKMADAITTRGQDVTAQTAAAGQDVTRRGQDITAQTTTRGQDVTAETAANANATTQRGQDITRATTERGQDIVADTAAAGHDVTRRGQDITAQTAAAGDVTTRRGQDITAQTTTRGQDITAQTAASGQDVTRRGQDITAQTAEKQIQADKDAAALLARAPKSDTAIAVREYNDELYGKKGSPEAVKRLNDEINFATTHKGPDTILMQGGGTIRQKLYETMGTKIIPAYMAEASQAGNLTRQMDVLDQLDPTVSGPILGGLAEAYPFLKNFDSQASAFEAIVKLAAPRQREEGSGSTSDIEYQGMLESLPQLATNPEARKLVSEVVRAQAAISLARGEAIRKFQNDANNPNADTELFNALADIDSRHVVSPRLQQMIDEIKGKKGAAAQTAPGSGSLKPGIVSISPAD